MNTDNRAETFEIVYRIS